MIRPPLSSLVALCVVAVPLTAQSAAGSESYLVLSHGTPALGGIATNATRSLEHAVGQPGRGAVGTSSFFQLVDGVVSMQPPLGTLLPIVFGVPAGVGDKDGDELVTLFGANFTAPGAGATQVSFGGAPATNVTVVDDHVLTARTPLGVDGFSNPIGLTTVEVSNSLGSSSAESSFVYEPALVQLTDAQVGKPIGFSFFAPPLSFFLVVYGGTIPSAPFLFIPFEGTVVLPTFPVFATGVLLTVSGKETFFFNLPDNPVLVGFTVNFQALSITQVAPPLVGSFTNLLPLLLLP